MTVLKGWKPGAISKRLLKKLNEAKRSKFVIEEIKRTKKTKKCIEDKPTLIISKKEGEYRIEMQATPESNAETVERYSPLIYRIAKENNADRNKKRERLQRKLIRQAINNVGIDNTDPKACDDICLGAYKQATGVLSNGDNYSANPEYKPFDSCSCSDDEVDSSCTSSEVEWEIHFSPPTVCQK